VLDTSIQHTNPGTNDVSSTTWQHYSIPADAARAQWTGDRPGRAGQPQHLELAWVYERENRAVDANGALWAALADRVDWYGELERSPRPGG
jgi:hypothetical protein